MAKKTNGWIEAAEMNAEFIRCEKRSEQVKGILEHSVLTVNTFLFIMRRGCFAVKLFEEYN